MQTLNPKVQPEIQTLNPKLFPKMQTLNPKVQPEVGLTSQEHKKIRTTACSPNYGGWSGLLCEEEEQEDKP